MDDLYPQPLLIWNSSAAANFLVTAYFLQTEKEKNKEAKELANSIIQGVVFAIREMNAEPESQEAKDLAFQRFAKEMLESGRDC